MSASTPTAQQQQQQQQQQSKMCIVCREDVSDQDKESTWTDMPCKCKGSAALHVGECSELWMQSGVRSNGADRGGIDRLGPDVQKVRVACKTCSAEFHVEVDLCPPMPWSRVARVAIASSIPFVAALMVIGAVLNTTIEVIVLWFFLADKDGSRWLTFAYLLVLSTTCDVARTKIGISLEKTASSFISGRPQAGNKERESFAYVAVSLLLESLLAAYVYPFRFPESILSMEPFRCIAVRLAMSVPCSALALVISHQKEIRHRIRRLAMNPVYRPVRPRAD